MLMWSYFHVDATLVRSFLHVDATLVRSFLHVDATLTRWCYAREILLARWWYAHEFLLARWCYAHVISLAWDPTSTLMLQMHAKFRLTYNWMIFYNSSGWSLTILLRCFQKKMFHRFSQHMTINTCFGDAVNSCGSEQRHIFSRMLYSRTVSLPETGSGFASLRPMC